MKKNLVAVLGTALLAVAANAQFTIDGTRDAAYPASTVFQTNATGYGDSNTGTAGGNLTSANGSELDGAYAELADGFLNIIFTGNLETNFNKLDIFFDAPGITTGQNVLNTTGGIGGFNGLTFDSGFAPDFFIRVNGGNSPNEFFVNYTTLVTGTPASFDGADGLNYLGTNNGQNGGVLTGGGSAAPAASADFRFAINNTNTGGVTGASGTGGETVTTGAEFRIPTSLIGDVTFGSGVLVSAFIANGGGNELSNQVLGGLPSGTGNLGPGSGVNFSTIDGNQFFAVPEPATMAALGFGALALLRRRRASK